MLYRIADFSVEITFAEGGCNDERLIPSFSVFEATEKSEFGKYENLFRIFVDDNLTPLKDGKERIGKFETGNGETVVDHFPDGSYQYIIKDVNGDECCLLQSDSAFSSCRCALNGSFSMRRFGLNNALMLVFAFAGCRRKTLLIHASLVRHAGWAYAFIAKSGTGKSTQVSNWLRYIPDCDLMNDDNPIVRVIDGQVFIYGSPWSGKTTCYRNVKARLGALTRIERCTSNSVERMPVVKAFASVLPSCSAMKWDKEIYDHICNIVSEVISTTPVYTLHCLPDRESAELCCKTIARPR